jgi:hypothetical protein
LPDTLASLLAGLLLILPLASHRLSAQSLTIANATVVVDVSNGVGHQAALTDVDVIAKSPDPKKAIR